MDSARATNVPSAGNPANTSNGGNAANTPSSPSTLKGDSPPRPPPGPKMCGVCNEQRAKYKCPRCTFPYCSVACNRIHKEEHPPNAPPPEKPSEVVPRPRAADRHHFDVLFEHRAEIAKLFQKFPGLQQKLAEIQNATNPPETSGGNDFTRAMQQQAIAATTGRKEQPWTREIGWRRGVDELRKARSDLTDVGDGVREYCELVKYLLAKDSHKDAVGAVREEVVAEEARAVQRLLQEETNQDA
ncbi:hypothetical protein OQA88_12310 [Cercophora sp. LCS_1]